MFDKILVHLTIKTLFGWLGELDRHRIERAARLGHITHQQEQDLLYTFVPYMQELP